MNTGDFCLEKNRRSLEVKKFWQLWLTSLLAVLLLAACGGNAGEETPKKEDPPVAVEDTGEEDDAEESLYPLTFKDAQDNEITVEEAPKTIISMIPSNTEILYELGLSEEIIAVTDNDDFPPGVEEKESIGGLQFNVEKIISLNPEMVLAHEMNLSAGPEAFDQIRDAGIPVVIIPNAESFTETYETIELIGKITNKVEEATTIIETMKAKVEEVKAKTATVEVKDVFIETTDVPEIYTPGAATFPQEMLDLINAKNIVTEPNWLVISPEEIISKNPDVIIVMYNFVPDIVESIKKRDGFDNVTAVKENAVVQVDMNLLSRTGPRLADGLEALAKAIYPEAFHE